jgi:hypothetical protein
MGSAKKALIDKPLKAVEKGVKKVGKETFDVVMGTKDEERRAMLYGEMPSAGETETPTQATESASPAVKRSVLAGQLGSGGESAKRRKFIG